MEVRWERGWVLSVMSAWCSFQQLVCLPRVLPSWLLGGLPGCCVVSVSYPIQLLFTVYLVSCPFAEYRLPCLIQLLCTVLPMSYLAMYCLPCFLPSCCVPSTWFPTQLLCILCLVVYQAALCCC
jgi:hypothetical protein